LAGGVIELRRHHPTGGVRSVVVMQGEKRRSEQQFSPTGKLLRDIQWDEYQQRTQTDWSDTGRVQRRVMQSLFEGRSVTAVEEYWPNGLLRERSTRDANDQPVGLMQRFDEAGKLSEELIANDPQAGRVR
jgi:antitoxin component YwqK of YwqJK toxin-antitoxin module